MPADPKVMAEAKRWIGHAGPKHTWEITRQTIYRFTIALGDKNPLYRDDDYARQVGYAGIIAPPMFYVTMHLPEDDLDRLDGAGLGPNLGPRFEVPVPGFPGAVAGGRDIQFGEPFRPGDTITSQEKVVDVYEKEGRRGPMVFIITEHLYTNQRGQMCIRERHTLIRHQ